MSMKSEIPVPVLPNGDTTATILNGGVNGEAGDDLISEEGSASGDSGSVSERRSSGSQEPKTPTKNPPHIRDTKASRIRIESTHFEHKESDSYMTPYQRKEQAIRDLRSQLGNLKRLNDDKEREIVEFDYRKKKEIDQILEDKEREIRYLKEQLADVIHQQEKLKQTYSSSLSAIDQLQSQLQKLQTAYDEKEKTNQDLFFKMYQKGQDTARIERQNELEEEVREHPETVSIEELVQKLKITNDELVKWQTLQRRQAYEDANIPESEADAILHCLKDVIFHYLTEEDARRDEYLRLLIELLHFSDVQLDHVRKTLKIKKKKMKIKNNVEPQSSAKAIENEEEEEGE